MASTMSEKFVNNFMTIMIARLAMILTPILLAIFGYVAVELWGRAVEEWDRVNRRIDAIEQTEAQQGSQIQDHESRLKFASQQADQFAVQIERRFNDLTGSLKDVSSQIGTINGSIIRLQTTIENRLPPRTAKIQPDPNEKAELPQ